MAVTTNLALAIFAAIAVISSVSGSEPENYLDSPPDTDWGVWGYEESCPFGRFAQGFQLKTEPIRFTEDDTALNGIRLVCGDPTRPDTAIISSTVGEFGEWGRVYSCYPGRLTGFQLRVESPVITGDDTATNNVRFFCSALSSPNDYIQGDGLSWGSWRDPLRCFPNQGICSIQTQVEPNLGDGDDTALNRVSMGCCNVPVHTKAADAIEPKNHE